MRSSALITTSVLVCLIAYSPIDWPQNQDENVVENYTLEIPTDNNGYDGDSDSDNVVGNRVCCENVEFTNQVNVVYSGGSINGNTIIGNVWFKDGSYTSGNVLGTFTSNNINTTVGQSIGLGSGHGNGGPGWWN